MSRIYFHSPSDTAELRGSERAWLGHIAAGPAKAAWDIDRHTDLDRMADIINLIPEQPDDGYGANYLHAALREAQTEASGSRVEKFQRLRTSLDLTLNSRHADSTLVIGGHRLNIADVNLNTALAAGSQPVQLAAKVDGWCKAHCWVDGPDRAWLAGIIDEGLRVGIFRRGLWYTDQPGGPKDKWSDQGWDPVLTLLRSRNDEPVVLSYSVCDQFPNSSVADWRAAPMPNGWEPAWADTDEGHAEWLRDYPTADDQRAYYDGQAHSQWYDLSDDEQWTLAMAGLRTNSPWLQLTPESLGGTTFGPSVTVYDVLAPDREYRVTQALALESA